MAVCLSTSPPPPQPQPYPCGWCVQPLALLIPLNTLCARRAGAPGNPDPQPPPVCPLRPVLSKVGFRETRAGPRAYGRTGPDPPPPRPAPSSPFGKEARVIFFLASPVASSPYSTSCHLDRSSPLSTETAGRGAYKLDASPCSLPARGALAVSNRQPCSLAWPALDGRTQRSWEAPPSPCPLPSSIPIAASFHLNTVPSPSQPPSPRLGNSPDIVF